MANKEEKYFSKFEGKEIDHSVDYTQSLENGSTFKIVGTSVDLKVDLNTLTKPGIYIVHYYENSKDDTKSSLPIKLTVFYIDENTVGQKYELNSRTVSRTCDKQTSTWTEWEFTSINTLFVEGNTKVSVSDNTLIFRHTNLKDASIQK